MSATPPSSRGASYEVREVMAENLLAATGKPVREKKETPRRAGGTRHRRSGNKRR